MKELGLYGIMAAAVAAATASWMFSLETLFVLGAVITVALGIILGVVIGFMSLSGRIYAELAQEKAAWRDVQANTTVPHR